MSAKKPIALALLELSGDVETACESMMRPVISTNSRRRRPKPAGASAHGYRENRRRPPWAFTRTFVERRS